MRGRPRVSVRCPGRRLRRGGRQGGLGPSGGRRRAPRYQAPSGRTGASRGDQHSTVRVGSSISRASLGTPGEGRGCPVGLGAGQPRGAVRVGRGQELCTLGGWSTRGAGRGARGSWSDTGDIGTVGRTEASLGGREGGDSDGFEQSSDKGITVVAGEWVLLPPPVR